MIRIKITGEMSMPPRLGSNAPYRPQERFGNAVKEFADRRHDMVAGIDHIEGNQPGQHGRRDQEPDVDLQNQYEMIVENSSA